MSQHWNICLLPPTHDCLASTRQTTEPLCPKHIVFFLHRLPGYSCPDSCSDVGFSGHLTGSFLAMEVYKAWKFPQYIFVPSSKKTRGEMGSLLQQSHKNTWCDSEGCVDMNHPPGIPSRKNGLWVLGGHLHSACCKREPHVPVPS